VTPNSPWTNVSTFLIDIPTAVVKRRILNHRFPKSVLSLVLGPHSFLKCCAEQSKCKCGRPFRHFRNFLLHFLTHSSLLRPSLDNCNKFRLAKLALSVETKFLYEHLLDSFDVSTKHHSLP